MKKIILSIIIFFLLIPFVNASSNSAVGIDEKYYDTFLEAFKDAKDGSVLKLFSNVSLEDGLIIDKNIQIDLNGNTIEAPTSVFEIKNGHLKLTGKGEIKETEPNYGVVRLIGSESPTGEKYSSVFVDKDVKLTGWAGIFVTHTNKKSYGVHVEIDGTIEAVNDISGGTGIGVYVNGNISDKEYSPVINIMDNAKITSTGDGLYIGGYSKVKIGKSNINGSEAGLALKSGIIEINGATITSNGVDKTPTLGYSNGINASGTAIQIESNKDYAGNIELTINNGTFKSKNSYSVYEYIGKGEKTSVNKLEINDGTFISNENKKTLVFSESLTYKLKGFVKGGKYTTDPKEYVNSNYNVKLIDNMYNVINPNELSTFANIKNSSNVYLIILTLFIVIISFILYKKRHVILKK